MATPEKRNPYNMTPPISSKKTSHMKSSVKNKRLTEQFQPTLYITRELTEADILLIKEAFDHHDTNKMGLLTPNDLKQALFHHNFYASKETVYNLIAQYDDEGLGGLTFDAFVRVVGCQPSQTQSSNDLKKIFRKYDRENKGYMTAKDLFEVVKSLGEKMSAGECDELFKTLDKQNQGKINFQDFCVLMHHPDSLK